MRQAPTAQEFPTPSTAALVQMGRSSRCKPLVSRVLSKKAKGMGETIIVQ